MKPKIKISVLPNGVVAVTNPYVNIDIEVEGAIVANKDADPLDLAFIDVCFTLRDVLVNHHELGLHNGLDLGDFQPYVNALGDYAQLIMRRIPQGGGVVTIDEYEWDDLDTYFSDELDRLGINLPNNDDEDDDE